ncbi:MAG: hypothetical protein NXI32_11485 [bacterium]|nr:hypothetical protein [bacterium]
MQADYPDRPAYFAQRFIRLMVKSAAAQHIGTDAFALLSVVATTEDARRYAGPVAYYNEQLMALVGFGSKKRLVAARRRAIHAGWLSYRPGGKGIAGLYYVKIPQELTTIPDGPSDESGEIRRSVSERKAEREIDQKTISRFDSEPKRTPKRNGKGAPYKPSPIPIPKESANAYLREFAELWSLIPKKRDKQAALKAYRSARRCYTAEHIRELAEAYYSQSVDPQFLKYPASFLRKCLDDDPSEWQESASRPELRPFERARV